MAKIGTVFSGNFLKAEDLTGRTVRVTIASAEVKEFDDGKKIVVAFQGKEKQLVCNKTNANIIAENVGSDETDDWIGRTIQLTTKKVEFQGVLKPAIRVVLEETAPTRPAPRQGLPASRQAMSADRQAEPADPAPAASLADNNDDVPF